MEGKAVLFKEFADIDAFPICLKEQNIENSKKEEIPVMHTEEVLSILELMLSKPLRVEV